MKTLTTSNKELQVGRICTLDRDWTVSVQSSDRNISVTLPRNLEVVILPQMQLRNNLSLKDLFSSYGFSVSILTSTVNKNFRFDHIGTCCNLPKEVLNPTTEMIASWLDLDWKAVQWVAHDYGLSPHAFSQVIGRSGIKDLVQLLRRFQPMRRNFMLVKCPQCGNVTPINISQERYCQNPKCGYSFQATKANFKKVLDKSFTEIITTLA